MTKTRKRIVVGLVILGSIIFLAFAVPYSINICTNHRFHYFWKELGGIFVFGSDKYTSLGYTPNKKYALHLVDSSWQGNYIAIETTRRFSYKPTEILLLSDEDLKAPIGPFKKDSDVVCSENSHYIAIIRKGWFIDFYDFKNKKRDSLDVVLVGEIDKENMNQWEEYHNKISGIMGDDFISIIPNDSDSR